MSILTLIELPKFRVKNPNCVGVSWPCVGAHCCPKRLAPHRRTAWLHLEGGQLENSFKKQHTVFQQKPKRSVYLEHLKSVNFLLTIYELLCIFIMTERGLFRKPIWKQSLCSINKLLKFIFFPLLMFISPIVPREHALVPLWKSMNVNAYSSHLHLWVASELCSRVWGTSPHYLESSAWASL